MGAKSSEIKDVESNDENDWRFTNQDKYLDKKILYYCIFDSTVREHDHCEFCFAKFGESENDVQVGYCTEDKYHWICEKCYNDFKTIFCWNVIDENNVL